MPLPNFVELIADLERITKEMSQVTNKLMAERIARNVNIGDGRLAPNGQPKGRVPSRRNGNAVQPRKGKKRKPFAYTGRSD